MVLNGDNENEFSVNVDEIFCHSHGNKLSSSNMFFFLIIIFHYRLIPPCRVVMGGNVFS